MMHGHVQARHVTRRMQWFGMRSRSARVAISRRGRAHSRLHQQDPQ